MVVFSLAFLPVTASAGFSWENNITVWENGMVWEYTEEYTGANAILFKEYIDTDPGNNDGFISAWELLKFDSIIRKTFYDSIINNMDVKINNSSSAVHLVDVDSSLCDEALGKVSKSAGITNVYRVSYTFDDPVLKLGNSIWFLGEPETPVTITLPAGVDVTSTNGIENTTTTVQNGSATISGTFDFVGEITIGYAENMTWAVTPAEVAGNVTPVPDATERPLQPKNRSEFFEEILQKLGFCPKR